MGVPPMRPLARCVALLLNIYLQRPRMGETPMPRADRSALDRWVYFLYNHLQTVVSKAPLMRGFLVEGVSCLSVLLISGPEPESR
jgi:hypothetical protein